MSCSSCSNSAFTCNNASFSQPLPSSCALTSLTPGVPAHYFNLYCPSPAQVTCYTTSANHGISCQAYNGYQQPMVITLPGHTPSCPTTSNPCPCSCGCSC